jgi:tetratricopeptide (TPR) repeat protein
MSRDRATVPLKPGTTYEGYVVSAFNRRTVAVTVCALTLTAGCASDRQSLHPVSLPDLSKADRSVQRQLREGYAALTARTGNPGTPDLDLGGAFGEMGKLLMAADYRDAAEPCFYNAQALAPNEMRWPYYLAHLYKERGDPARAMVSFERSLELKPDDLPTLVWLGNAYLDQGRSADAQRLFSQAFAVEPRSAAALFGLGRTALAKQEYGRAVDRLEQALSLDPKAAAIHYPLAMAYRAKGDVPQAEAHLRARGPGDVRLRDPLMQELEEMLESPVAYEARGAQALDESDWAAAAGYFRKGIALAPNEPSLRHKLGTALAMRGETPAAVEQFEEITRRWPRFSKAHYSLGLIFMSSGRSQDAIRHLAEAVKSDPAYSEARLQLADALRATGRFEQSLRQYEETIRLNPRLAEARLGRGMALAGLGRFDDARVQFSEGAKLYPQRREFAEALSRLSGTGASR